MKRIAHNKINRIGHTQGRLTVIADAGSDKFGIKLWLCKCSCGKETVTRFRKVKSCGCLKKELLAAGQPTHGLMKNHTRAYKSWTGMRARCLNPNNHKYKNYGGRGITICERWLKFENFYADMGDPPVKMSLDRIDNNGPYSPENCRWATNLDQSRNRRDNHIIEFNGETLCLKSWGERTSLGWSTIQKRLKLNWSIERALTTPSLSKPRD